jgi:uroporphyrinogen decarboxylase
VDDERTSLHDVPSVESAMTPRELVIRTLEFDSPPRLARQLWLLPWAVQHFPKEVAELGKRFPDDIISSPAFCTAELPVRGDRHAKGAYVDEWGCTFENIADGIIGEVKQPLFAEWSNLDRLRIPAERLTVDVDQVNGFCRQIDRFVLAGTVPRIFERLQFLRGSENMFCDLIDQPAELSFLISRIHEFYLEELSLWATTQVDALYIMDDWGGQRAMLISPALWRSIFKPLYAEYVKVAHACGKYFFMHSDGYILDILADLVEIGVDAINAQIFCMGPERLGEQFAGKLTFWGELDRQQLLPHGSRDEIRAAVEQMKNALDRDGGLIAQCEFSAGADPNNVFAFFEACANE